MREHITYCGFIAIVGRPNVGKSTVLNQLIEQKISITSRKPHTTRHEIIGVQSEGIYQSIYIDTPGLCIEEKNTIHRFMNRAIKNSITKARLVIFIIEGINWTVADKMIMHYLKEKSLVLLVLNKIDIISNKSLLLPHLQRLSQKRRFVDIVPISAKLGTNINVISNIVHKYLLKSEHYFPETCITNRSQKFMASEIIREKIIRYLGGELPYSVMVEIEQFFINKNGMLIIYGIILVHSASHKKIVIGHNGAKIKSIGIAARHNMETIFGHKVHLELWVKMTSGERDYQDTVSDIEYKNIIPLKKNLD
ncbi:GTPase Era [Candidatus Erwinia haradaeae]|uniref:GTPase Era n=1 Tax=Candidatus Erwinia haradaeae TaxID=1922217 RepID=A0A451DGA1_9GAMM|nr:GTPase Era [Candidatus Erwinia haradaeae]VFP85659.1 GTPase Era [Candidatus Erwinia haradaeae]